MFQRILVGTPASDVPPAALDAAAELANSYDAELVVLQVRPAIDARRVFDPDGVPPPTDHVTTLMRSYPGLRVRSRSALGNAARHLSLLADEERPDLIVVPCGRSTGADVLLSRRASRTLVDRSPCPVMLVAS